MVALVEIEFTEYCCTVEVTDDLLDSWIKCHSCFISVFACCISTQSVILPGDLGLGSMTIRDT